MPAPRRVATSLRRTAVNLAKIPDDAVRAVGEDIVAEAIATGGRFTRRGYPLYAETRVRGGKRTRTAVVFGKPAGYWSIKTYGRSAMRVTGRNRKGRPSGFPISAGTFRRSAGPAGPAARNWSDVVTYANERAPELVGEIVDEAVTARG